MTWKTIMIRIDQPPKGKGTGRANPKTGGVFTPKATKKALKAFAVAAGQAYDGPTFQAPITMELVAVLARPKRLLRLADPDGRISCPVKPDLSNVLKLAEDGLQRCRGCGRLPPREGKKGDRCTCPEFRPTIGDDAWIVDSRQSKFYGAILDRAEKRCEEPHVVVALTGKVDG